MHDVRRELQALPSVSEAEAHDLAAALTRSFRAYERQYEHAGAVNQGRAKAAASEVVRWLVFHPNEAASLGLKAGDQWMGATICLSSSIATKSARIVLDCLRTARPRVIRLSTELALVEVARG